MAIKSALTRATVVRPMSIVIVLVLFLMAVTSTAAQDRLDLARQALQSVAQQHSLPLGTLRVINRADVVYPTQARTGVEFKVMDTRDGTIYGVTLDSRGRELDGARLMAAEQAAHEARYGKLEPALAERLTGTSAQAAVEVIIWLKEDLSNLPQRPDPDTARQRLTSPSQIQSFYAQVDQARAATVQARVAPLVRRLSGRGIAVGTDKYTPVLYARLSPRMIQEVAAWPEVDRVYLSPVNQSELEIVRPTIGADVVEARGITGSGVQVAQIEVGGRIATANPNLAGVTQDTSFVCATASSHSTGVAGIIRSTNATRRGVAPGATLWAGGSCGGVSSELQNRSTAAADWGARALNLSWGSNIGLVPGANDRFYDTMVLTRFRTIVKSAGNEAGPCNSGSGNVTSPGLAYNIITVGNFDDLNTVSWAGDVMDSCSSFVDPTSGHSDREKPEVAGPGSNINSTTTASPWTGAIGSGTSFAAPTVTGGAALLIQRDAGLSVWPEGVKAILMTTAVHNIEGDARLSENDGAGGIALDRADDIANNIGGDWGATSYSCSTTTPLDVASIPLTGGVRTRATIVWDTDPNYASYTTQPSADLDFQVIDPSGLFVAGSASWDNTYEIVDFTPATTGNYLLRVVRFRCDLTPQWLAWAWRQGN